MLRPVHYGAQFTNSGRPHPQQGQVWNSIYRYIVTIKNKFLLILVVEILAVPTDGAQLLPIAAHRLIKIVKISQHLCEDTITKRSTTYTWGL